MQISDDSCLICLQNPSLIGQLPPDIHIATQRNTNPAKYANNDGVDAFNMPPAVLLWSHPQRATKRQKISLHYAFESGNGIQL